MAAETLVTILQPLLRCQVEIQNGTQRAACDLAIKPLDDTAPPPTRTRRRRKAPRSGLSGEQQGVRPAPILRIPAELTARIFEDVRLDVLQTERRIRPSIDTPPLVFTRICSNWRAIALGTGSFWSCIDLFVEDPTLELIDNAHSILATWSERARSCPLSWTLGGYVTLPPMFPILATQLHRLELNAYEPDMDVFGTIATSTGFPQLQELALHHHVFDDEEIPATIAQVLASAPAIEAISLSFSAPTHFTGAETPRLTTLQVKKITLSTLRALFQHCSGRDFPPTAAPFIAPNLQTVVIPWDAAVDDAVMPFAHFSFPSLKYLHLPYTPNLHVVSEFFHRSGCSIDNLNVSISMTAQVLELQSIFDHMPSITTLEIWRSEDYEDDDPSPSPIPAVILALSAPGVLPRLRNLTIHIGGIHEPKPYTVSYVGVVSLLDARSSPNSAFRSFHLDVDPTDPFLFAEKYTPPSFFLSRIEKLAQWEAAWLSGYHAALVSE
ncbi:hypothetical protein B0H11DRAFT_2202328 [Mycena galericulata]|nr:hypothetical protein B0H11DRAFT_2202328 [Mycena galericulata]